MGGWISKCNTPVDKEKLFEIINNLVEEFVYQYCDFHEDYFEHADIINTAFKVFIKIKNYEKEYKQALELGWKRNYHLKYKVNLYQKMHYTGSFIEYIDTVYVGMKLGRFPKYP